MDSIERDVVWAAKRHALAEEFAAGRDHERWRWWAEAHGDDLTLFCVFDALADEHGPDWRQWPEDVRHPAGPGVAARLTDPELIARHELVAWTQWRLATDLADAAEAAQPCVLIGDLAVGCSPDGADSWIHQDLFAHGVTIGAPPDPFTADGQLWGLPPLVPWRLRQARYAPFIAMLRAAFGSMGGVRIDHVMGLFRQFWVPDGRRCGRRGVRLPAPRGAARPGVPRGVARRRLRHRRGPRHRSSRRCAPRWPTPGCSAPRCGCSTRTAATWPEPNLGTVTTHDLPTVAGVWSGEETDEREPFEELVGREATTTDALVAAHAAIAAGPARLVLATVDDLAGSTVRPNSPGTEGEHNWCHRLAAPAVDLLARSPGAEIVEAMSAARSRSLRRTTMASTAADIDIDIDIDARGVDVSRLCPRWDSNPHALADNGF